ncbi:MAG: NPCBM/NEW2 domain-containing protein [Lacipirellulaceae bacterium]
MERVGHAARALALVVALVALVATGAPAQPVMTRIETLEGPTAGMLRSLDSEALRIDVDGELTAVPTDQVVRLEFDTPADTPARARLGEVTLVEGSVVPFEMARFAAESVRLEIGPVDRPALRVDTPLGNVLSWRTPASLPDPDSAALESQWRAIAVRSATTDAVVVRSKGGASIDFIDGVVERVGAEGVGFAVEGEAIDVPWSRVFGLVFFRPGASTEAAPTLDRGSARVIVTGAAGLRLVATSVEMKDGRFAYELGGARGTVGVALVESLDYSAGTVVFASEMAVEESRWTPLAEGAPTRDPGAVLTLPGAPVADHALGGEPLSLRFADPRAPRVWQTKRFARGWAIRSRGTVTLRLPAGARRLRGWVGIDPLTAESGAAIARVLVDGAEVLKATIDGDTPPVEVDAPLGAAVATPRVLTLEVDYGDNLDTGDNVHFADLRVTR